MAQIKFQIRLGGNELNYEGDQAHFDSVVVPLLKDLNAPSTQVRSPAAPSSDSTQVTSDLGTESIAARIGTKSGPDLILAAAAKLTFTDQKSSFSGKELLAEMKTAKSFFKASYGSNFAANLSGMVKKTSLNSSGSDSYALSHEKKTELRGLLKA